MYILTHMKLCLAGANHNFEWDKITCNKIMYNFKQNI